MEPKADEMLSPEAVASYRDDLRSNLEGAGTLQQVPTELLQEVAGALEAQV